jgi:hypothetical protein
LVVLVNRLPLNDQQLRRLVRSFDFCLETAEKRTGSNITSTSATASERRSSRRSRGDGQEVGKVDQPLSVKHTEIPLAKRRQAD